MWAGSPGRTVGPGWPGLELALRFSRGGRGAREGAHIKEREVHRLVTIDTAGHRVYRTGTRSESAAHAY